jgi:Bacterial Ig-like domain (group 1)
MCLKKLNFQAETEPRRGNTVQKIFSSLNLSLRVLLMGAITALVVAGCGGSGAGSGTTPTPTPAPGTGGPAASLQLLASSQQIKSDGTEAVNLTAVVLDAGGAAITDKLVTFKVTDPNGSAFLNNIGGSSGKATTDTNGTLTAILNLGNNKGNRTISVSASADAATSANQVVVAGTTVTISGANSMVFNSTNALTVLVKDASGKGIPGAPVSITSDLGNTLSLPAPAVTDALGQFKFDVKATKAGNDKLTVNALGATTTSAISVSGANFIFVTPPTAPANQVTVNIPQALTVHWDEAGAPKVGQPVTLTTTRGTITPSILAVDASGNVTATISSPSAGLATVTATGPGGVPSTSLELIFVTKTASAINVQADKTTLPINVSGATTSRARITAVVRDAANNLVKDARVNFNIAKDTSGGSLSTGSSITDISGAASVDYVAGTISSAQNGVEIQATVVDVGGAAVTVAPGSVFLTVGGQSLFVRLETDNTIGSSGVTYVKSYVALVTDSAGNPIVGVPVQFKLKPADSPNFAYFKGQHFATPTAWVQSVAASCYNEDINYNGVLDPLEDVNGDGLLTPGNVASVNTNVATDNSGFATANVTYAKNYARWATVTLEAKISVAGTESVASTTFVLLGLAADYNDIKVNPPGRFSPFGTAAACTDPN